jgi:hypothetical protein
MSIFLESTLLLRAVESRLLSESESHIPLLSHAKRLLWYPLKFLKLGVSEKAKSASIWAFLSFASLMIGAWIINNSGVAKTESANLVMLASMTAPLFVVLFAVPSTYGSAGLSLEVVNSVVAYLQSRPIHDSKDIDLIKKSIKPFEDRSRSRVTILKWLVGLAWAGFTYTFSKGIENAAATPAQVVAYAQTTAFFFLAVIAAYLVVWGYEAALDKVFRLIEFASNDRISQLDRGAKSAA